ncbi:hypothetical protein niasHT_007345 [Heterodera trifolii]|uniref:Ubiquitin carboxyl-terminal hydrolase n=1 Tax=Heterodera trifolii TaxID=157864 RepID=A0ABD2LLC8_9BILA
MLNTKEISINSTEGSAYDQVKDNMPCEAAEAIGKAAIPLPCPESLLMKKLTVHPDIMDSVRELDNKYLRPLEDSYFDRIGQGPTEHTDENAQRPELLDENGHRYVGLFNQAMTCYLNSLIQTLYMTPEFRNKVYSWKFVDTATDEDNKNIPYQLQRLFLLLQTSEKASLETKELTTSFGWVSNEAFEQHDVQELCRIMFDALEQRWRKTENDESAVHKLYKGTMEDYVKCLRCKKENVRKDDFLDLSLAVRPFGASESFKSIEEALSAFIKPEILNGNNQYQCEVCASRQDAEKGLRIVEFPYLLTIQLKRFDFDYAALHRIKLNDRVTFPDYLDVNDFVYSPSASTQPKPSYAEMAKKPPEQEPSVHPSTNGQCTSATADEVAADCPNGEGPSGHRLVDEKTRSEHIAQLLKRGKYIYELFSIMVHQGSASAGHYFAYIKNLDQNKWFCFNDSSVHVASLGDIFRTFGGHANGWMNNMNAYMLMYRQIDHSQNEHFVRSTELPEHLILLKDKLEAEEEERSRQRQSDEQNYARQEENDPKFDSADLPLVEGAGDDLLVVGGDDLQMDISSCPGTPQISPMVSADEGDGDD